MLNLTQQLYIVRSTGIVEKPINNYVNIIRNQDFQKRKYQNKLMIMYDSSMKRDLDGKATPIILNTTGT